MMNVELIKHNLGKALFGGFLGTLAFSLMGMFLAPHILGHPMNIAAILANMLGVPIMMGTIMHFLVGTIAFPIAYLLFGYTRLPGAGWLRGMLFLIPIYLIAMIIVMPMAGKGMFFDNAPTAMVALMGHLVFGIIMGYIIGTPKEIAKN